MSLMQDFISYFKERGVNESNLPCHEYPDCTVMQIGDETNPAFTVFVTFYNDGGAEVFTVKNISYDDRLDILEKVNLLNDKYRGVYFVLGDNQIIAKSFCKPWEDVYGLIADLTSNTDATEKEFGMF